MRADRVRRTSHLFSDDLLDTTATIPISSSATSLASSSSSDSLPRVNYIEHRVSKMDTLPGVAIKYGVEVLGIRCLVLYLYTLESVKKIVINDASASLGTTELLLEDNSSDFPARKGKGLAMRPKLGSHTDVDMGHPKASPHGDCVMTDGFVSVRKSSSTSSLQDSENHSSIWLTSKWTLNPELLARPLFDGLPKPIIVRKNKAALD
ncbi:hypothetical protein BHE74_00019753 [Ensete ventricosum]|nr:hypothetical protein BHE74_00019753 [Ensete ventricosum]